MGTWAEEFAEGYDEWSRSLTEDVELYVDLALEAPDGLIVELAVGDGRVAIPVAAATGRPVLGVDTSPTMLARARERAQAAGVALELREADMRDVSLGGPAALVYCPFRALFHLHTWADRRALFERVAASLAPDGRFVWDAWAFDHRFAAQADGARLELPVPHTLRYAVGENRLDIVLENGAKSSMWWATKNEWLGLIDVAGLEVEALYGSYDREPFGEDSGLYVFVTRRAGH
jgi:SAM-dependent methyltransferase